MINVASISRSTLLALGMFALAACDNRSEPSPLRAMADQALAGVFGTDAEPLPPVTRQNGFLAVSDQFAASADGPVVAVVIEGRDAQALLTPSGANGPFVTWLSADRASFTFVAGAVLVRTSGLGHDLQNADVSQLLGAMASRQQGDLQREHVYLTRDFQQKRQVFQCNLASAGQVTITLAGRSRTTERFDETCSGEGQGFTNSYWFDGRSGMIVQSAQWVHPQVGRVFFQLLGQP